MREVWFHRDFRGYSGGHGKVFDYFGHVDAHPEFAARIYFTEGSVDADNPWRRTGVDVASAWRPEQADVLLLAGSDWSSVPDDRPGRPVLNLVQGVRHADPAEPLFNFLSRRAVRVCVSRPVADAIIATGRVNGPVITIEAGLELPGLPRKASVPGRIFIAAAKQPQLGAALAERLRADGRDVDLAIAWTDRASFLGRLADAERAVMLPFDAEGFFLPGLEAMALGVAAVIPDCVGNRDYLDHGTNALAPALELEALVDAVRDLDDPQRRAQLARAGRQTAARFSVARERSAVHAVLDRLDELWTS
ncbi:glycosyltransferase [Lysobacter xanthus]